MAEKLLDRTWRTRINGMDSPICEGHACKHSERLCINT